MYTIRHTQTKKYITQQPNQFNQYIGKVPLFVWTSKEDNAIRFETEEQASKSAENLWKLKRIQEGIPCFKVSDDLIQKITTSFKTDKPESYRVQIYIKSLEQANAKDGTLSSLLEVIDLGS